MTWGPGNGRTSTTDHKKRRLRVLKRDGYQCQLRLPGCTDLADTLDHIIAVAAGGPETDANTQASCAHCNALKARDEARAGRAAKGRKRPKQMPPWMA